jgi:ABC-2 type transport system ATP-binding protein
MDDLLKIKGLCKAYKDFSLSNVSFSVPQDSVVGLVGANGAGKTTIIRSALGIIPVNGGQLEICGALPAANVKQDVGIVFDTCSFPDEITVHDVARMMKASYSNWDAEVFSKNLQEFSLPTSRKIRELSRGMGMKLMLAIALSHQARLLVLDEATAGLDPLARDEVLEVLRSYMERPGRGILMSTHITSDLERIADYIVCIDAGKVLFSCDKDAITEVAGIARCRKDQFAAVMESGKLKPGETHFSCHAYGVDVLVDDRCAFTREFPEIAVEKASIDEYMRLTLKGDIR